MVNEFINELVAAAQREVAKWDAGGHVDASTKTGDQANKRICEKCPNCKIEIGSSHVTMGFMHSFILLTHEDNTGRLRKTFYRFGPDRTDMQEPHPYPNNPDHVDDPANKWDHNKNYTIIRYGGRSDHHPNIGTIGADNIGVLASQGRIRGVWGEYQDSYEEAHTVSLKEIASGLDYCHYHGKFVDAMQRLVNSGYWYFAFTYNCNASAATILEAVGLQWVAPDGNIYPGNDKRIPLRNEPPPHPYDEFPPDSPFYFGGWGVSKPMTPW